MPDFGDDFGDSLKRFSSMFLRELFHQWLRDSQKNGYYHETIGGEDFDVKLFDDDTQREGTSSTGSCSRTKNCSASPTIALPA